MSPPRYPSRRQVVRKVSSEQKLFLSVLASAVPVLLLLIYVYTDQDISLTPANVATLLKETAQNGIINPVGALESIVYGPPVW